MLANSFSDQPHMGLSSSGTLSHVYIQHPPLRCGIPETRGVYYDDGNKVLLSPTSDQVLSWKIGHSNQLDPPNSDSISEGSVLSIRYSLDRKVIGIQRSIHEIQFKNRDTGETFSRRCRPDNESILGFFWTDCPICDVIIIKTSGIDLLTYEPELKTLRLLEAKKFSVSWYIYTHESRMILLASGLQCTIFYGFQFSSNGVVRLPKFEMTMCKAEANQKPVLAAEDVHIATIYGRIYCLQLDRVGMQLNLYRFYRDAVVQQGTLPVYSSRIAVSVVDNVLLVHQIDAKVVILYDVFVDSLAPVSAPLPLLWRGPSNTSRQTNNDQGNMNNAYGRMIYGDSWNFLVPDLICDAENGMLWRMYLDMEAIAASSSDIPSLLEFLQRRRSDPSKIKMLCLSIMRTIILERRPIPMIARAIDVLVASYSLSVKLGNSLQGIERRASESFSNIQHIVDSKVVSEEAISSTANHEKDVGQKYLSGPNKSLEKDIKDKTLESASSSVLARSDFNGNANLENLSPERSLSGGSHDTEDRMATQTTGDQIIGVNLDQSQSGFDVERNNSQTEASVSVHQASQNLSVAVSPDEIYHFVLAVVEDEMLGDPSYLVSIVVEFLRSVSKEKFKVHPNVYVMTIQLLARDNRHAELGLFALNKIIEPSKEVALQLLESGRQNLQTKKLGIEMLRQLSLHHDHVSVLLEDGYYLEALRYARRNKIITVRPSLFLEAALASNNSQHLAAVLRFFSDFTPAFKSTSEYDQYHRVLAEMC